MYVIHTSIAGGLNNNVEGNYSNILGERSNDIEGNYTCVCSGYNSVDFTITSGGLGNVTKVIIQLYLEKLIM